MSLHGRVTVGGRIDRLGPAPGAGHVLRRCQPAWVGQWHLAFHPLIDDRRDRGQVPDAAW